MDPAGVVPSVTKTCNAHKGYRVKGYRVKGYWVTTVCLTPYET